MRHFQSNWAADAVKFPEMAETVAAVAARGQRPVCGGNDRLVRPNARSQGSGAGRIGGRSRGAVAALVLAVSGLWLLAWVNDVQAGHEASGWADELSRPGVLAQGVSINELFHDRDIHRMSRGPGGYLAGYKLLLIVLVASIWVGLVDYANREAIRLDQQLKTKAPIWSPIYLATMFVGLLIVLVVPWFWAGFPLYVLVVLAPPVAFFLTRNKQVEAGVRTAIGSTGRVVKALELVEVAADPVEIIPRVAGQSPQEVLFHARRSPSFPQLAAMLEDLLRRRGENLMVSCTREKTAVRIQIDGHWHPVAEFDTEQGKALLVVAQMLVGGKPELAARGVSGSFGVKKGRDKSTIRFTSQPTKTEYRGQFRLEAAADTVQTLSELGMPENLKERVRGAMGGDGIFVVAATPGQGMTTLWKSCLNAADRWTRDWYSVVPESDTETVMENVQRMTHPDGDVEAAIAVIRQLGLKQAGGYIVPQLFDPKLVDELISQSREEGRTTLTRVAAKSAAEGLLRAYAASADRKAMADQLRGVVYQRLVRKLCKNCREKQTVNPDLIRKLGGDPRIQDFLYATRTIPAEPPKDYRPCSVCNELGFVGRTGVFEVIVVNEAIKKTLLTQPKVEAIAEAARKAGAATLLQAGFPLLLDGTTSMDELKRVCAG